MFAYLKKILGLFFASSTKFFSNVILACLDLAVTSFFVWLNSFFVASFPHFAAQFVYLRFF